MNAVAELDQLKAADFTSLQSFDLLGVWIGYFGQCTTYNLILIRAKLQVEKLTNLVEVIFKDVQVGHGHQQSALQGLMTVYVAFPLTLLTWTLPISTTYRHCKVFLYVSMSSA